MSYISVKNLDFSYNNKKLFSDISFDLEKGSLTAVVSGNSCGKSTLLKIISSQIKTNAVTINDSKLNIMIFKPYPKFYSKTVYDELLVSANSNTKKIRKLLSEFNLLNKINESPLNLTYIEVQKLNFIKALLSKCNIVLMDDILSYFDKYSKLEFISIIKKYQYENNLTVIFTSSNLEDVIFCDSIIIIGNQKIIYNGEVDKVYLDEKILKDSKVNIPIFNELLEKLKLYSIVDDKICTIDEVVDEICK